MNPRSALLLSLALLACSEPPADGDVGGMDAAMRDATGSDVTAPDVPAGDVLGVDAPAAGDASVDAAGALSVSIVSPTDLTALRDAVLTRDSVLNAVVAGETIDMVGEASGGTPPYSFAWRSDLDGVLGTTETATITASEGDHELVLEVTDAMGLTGRSAPLPLYVLPATFDWSHVRRPSAPPAAGNWMTPVRNQDRCGSCWAFAALAVVEAQLNIASGNPALDVDLSEQWVVDCDSYFIGCSGGAPEQTLRGFLHDTGVPVETCNPFLGRDDVCMDACRDGSTPSRYRVTSTAYVVGDGGFNPAVQAWMRYQLVHHGPIPRSIINMLGYDPVTHHCDSMGGDHYVAVVGYDHAANLWIAKNSWGPSWNGDGYMEVAYGNCAIDASATIVDGVMAP